MSSKPTRRTLASTWLCAFLSLAIAGRQGLAAVPPAATGNSPAAAGDSAAGMPAAAAPAPGAQPAAAQGGMQSEGWTFPPVHLGGTLSYELRKDTGREQSNGQRGVTATINARTLSYIWQPWFSQWAVNLGVSATRDGNQRRLGDYDTTMKSSTVILTGTARLSILPLSRFPFEAHVERNDSRLNSDRIVLSDFASQRLGFTQRHVRDNGDAMLSFDRNTQTSETSGRDRQDTLQLTLSHTLDAHRLSASGTVTRNVHMATGDSTLLHNFTFQDSYAASDALSIESMVNLGRSGYKLVSGTSDTRMVQATSMAFWRPEEQPLIVTAGVRVLALNVANRTIFDPLTGNAVQHGARMRNVNVNGGVNYDLSKAARINANANLNHLDSTGRAGVTTHTQSAGISFQPESIALGGFRYNWSASASVSRHAGDAEATTRQITALLSHSLARSFTVPGGSSLSLEASQAIATIKNNRRVAVSEIGKSAAASTSTQVTHGMSLGWDAGLEEGVVQLRLSGSDSRGVTGSREVFRMVNFQALSSLPLSGVSSWSGNLTIQAIRQNRPVLGPGSVPLAVLVLHAKDQDTVYTSTGTLSYQHTRAFGVRGLRFASDLRLNSQALLPLVGGPKDQETAGWESRLDWNVGRLQMRLAALVAQSATLRRSIDPLTGIERIEESRKPNKSIMFTVARSFGDF